MTLRTPESDAAWARVNQILDENGGQGTPEYWRAWHEWELAVGVQCTCRRDGAPRQTHQAAHNTTESTDTKGRKADEH